MTDRELAGCALLPCPFCGGEAVTDRGMGLIGYYVTCRGADCGIGPSHQNKEEAEAAWNRRSPAVEGARDAARYRWLREGGEDPFVCGVHGAPFGDNGWLTGDLLDAAVDAAIDAAIAAAEGGDAPDLP